MIWFIWTRPRVSAGLPIGQHAKPWCNAGFRLGHLSTLIKVQPSSDSLFRRENFAWQSGPEGCKEERRLVWRVQRHWREITRGRRFPRRNVIEPWMRGEDGANCFLIVAESPVELSHFVVVGVNLAVALCPTDTLAGLLLSRVARVASARCGLIFQGATTLRGVDIFYRSVLLPLSEDGVVIDHVLGAVSYYSPPAEEALTPC